MKLEQQVRSAIEAQEEGILFTRKDIQTPDQGMEVAKSLSRYYRRGIIRKLAKGLYYKPRVSAITGREMAPDLDAILEKLREIQGAKVWYLTGTTAYNNLLITYQMSTTIDIATDRPRSPLRVGGTTLRFVRSRIPIPVTAPELAQLLDALQEIQKIPAASPKAVCKAVTSQIKTLTAPELRILMDYAQYYSPRTRALLGLCLDLAGQIQLAKRIKQSLNPKTLSYQAGLGRDALTTSLNWNIE